MASQLISTKQLMGKHVVGGKRHKRIGKVYHIVFHPTEKRVIGFTVKRPDAALMFHRKGLFVALNGYDFEEGNIVIRDNNDATGKDAAKALGVDWDRCVLWLGMPLITESGEFVGYVGDVTFDRESGAIQSLTIGNGTAKDLVLGKRVISSSFIKGFKLGQGMSLSIVENHRYEEDSSEKGAIFVSDDVLDIDYDGGAAAAAGKAAAVVTDKAKKGAAKAKSAMAEKATKAEPKVQRAAKKAEEVIETGAFAAGKQIGKASGMFAAFKEEFDKASQGKDDED